MFPETEQGVLEGLSFGAPAHDRMDLVEQLGHASRNLSNKFIEEVLVHVMKEDPNSIVRHEAACSLGRLHWDGKPLATATIHALCEAAERDRSCVARHEAAEVLGSISHPRVLQSLNRLLDDPDEDVVETARISLARHLTQQPR